MQEESPTFCESFGCRHVSGLYVQPFWLVALM
jgi:hypothetical protein